MKLYIDLKEKLLEYLKDKFYTFFKKEANKLTPYRKLEINYIIELIKKDRKTRIIFQGPLYNISQEELLVLY